MAMKRQQIWFKTFHIFFAKFNGMSTNRVSVHKFQIWASVIPVSVADPGFLGGEVGMPTYYLAKLFAKTGMKIKEIGTKRGVLVPPWTRHYV